MISRPKVVDPLDDGPQRQAKIADLAMILRLLISRKQTSRADRARLLLSDRELTVLRLVGEGLPNKRIATALTIAERTMKSYVTLAMNKLGTDNRAQAAVASIDPFRLRERH